MFKPLFDRLFIIAVLAYAVVRLARLNVYTLPNWINGYLSDLVCMPIVLTLALVGVRFFKRLPNYQLTSPMIFGLTVGYSIYFEWVLPNTSSAYTADKLDVAFYFIGAVVYWGYWRKKKSAGIPIV